MRDSFQALLAAGLLSLCAFLAGCASNSTGGAGGNTTVTFVNPEGFTDFRGNGPQGAADRDAMLRDLQRFIEQEAARSLPRGQILDVKVHDIDQGGSLSERRGSDVRVTSDSSSAEVDLDYVLTSSSGRIIKSGSESLVQNAVTMPTTGFEAGEEEMPLVKQAFRSWLKRLGRE